MRIKRERLLEVLFRLAGVADDEVRRQRDAGPHGLQLLDLRDVLLGRVAALHELQDAIRAALHGQVQVARELLHGRVRADERVRELRRMRRREANALDAVDLGDAADQRREVRFLAAAADGAFVRVDVLAEQRDLARAERGEPPRFREHVVERPADLLAARDRHDAVRARLAAAFHDGQERRARRRRRLRDLVELLDLGERHVDDARLTRSARARRAPASGATSAGRTRCRRTARASGSSAPSWLATQPPTPMMRFGFSSLSARQRPSSENTFSSAFSRTEHVFTSTMSACAASSWLAR